jgi:hypothetical protein
MKAERLEIAFSRRCGVIASKKSLNAHYRMNFQKRRNRAASFSGLIHL